MERIFNRVKLIHLSYIAETIEKYGHAILHGDGNIYVDIEGRQREHQPSFIAKTFAGVGNEAAQYRVRFTSIKQVPETIDELEKLLMDAKAKEAFEEGRIETTDNFKSIGGKTATKNNDLAEAKTQADEAKAEAEAAKAEAKTAKQTAEAAKAEAKTQADENAKLKAQIEKLQAAKKDEKK